jgi:hypothetical protein
MIPVARVRPPNFQIFYKNFQERFSPRLLHFVNATVYDALHGTRHRIAPAWAGIISDASVGWFVPDISYNRTGRRQSLARVFNLGQF